jgi:oligopeptide/dipeptide ABC transporter ATP-binding protein
MFFKRKKQAIQAQTDLILDVEDLSTHFFTEEGIVRAVDGVSFTIQKDEIMGLVGETGCGKSVTALSILNLIRPPGKIIGGKIIFDGENLTEKSENELRHYRGNSITMIFQDPMNSLNPVFKIGEQLGEVYLLHQKEFLKSSLESLKSQVREKKAQLKNLKVQLTTTTDEKEIRKIQDEIKELKQQIPKKLNLKTIAWKEAAKLLTAVGIPDADQIVNRYPHELSGGMRQRAMISMALACNAKLLIADEPTTALDVTIQAQILELIRELKRTHHNSVLMITHSLGVIYELCDKVAVMYAGKIVETGKVHDIMENPLHPYTKGLLAAIPRINRDERLKDLNTIPGRVPNLINIPVGCRFADRCMYTMKKCMEVSPDLDEMEDGRKVACFLYDPEKNDPNLSAQYDSIKKSTTKSIGVE